MRSDHLSKHIKRCQNRENAAARANNSSISLNKPNVDANAMNASNQSCAALDCTYSANCVQCQNEGIAANEDTNGTFALPAVPLARNIPSPTSFSCPASMFYNHFEASLQQQQQNRIVAAAATTTANQLPTISSNNLISFSNNPFSLFNQSTKHSIDNLIFRPQTTFTPSYINEDSSSCSSLPPQLYFALN